MGLPWEANIHAAFTTEEMFYAMKASGCNQINVGCESGSPKILKDVRKGLKIDQLIRVFEWARKAKIERRGYFLLGMPNETEEDIRLTEKLVETVQPDVFGITILCPYPGSNMYDPKTMKNWDWTFADEYSNPYWSNSHFSNQQLKTWQKYLMNKFSDSLAWHNKIILDGEGVTTRSN
jgi:anaerobic magnesium-protoporphyrin IX monomethyl ester cyclase